MCVALVHAAARCTHLTDKFLCFGYPKFLTVKQLSNQPNGTGSDPSPRQTNTACCSMHQIGECWVIMQAE